MNEPSCVSWGDSRKPYVPPYFPLIHYVRTLPLVVGNLPPVARVEVELDLAPHSNEYCAARGIRPAREDFAVHEMIELPAPEFRRNVLVAAAEMVFK